MNPFLIGARFERVLKPEWKAFLAFAAWLADRDGYLIAASGDSIWALIATDDLEREFEALRRELDPFGLQELDFLEVGSRAWESDRKPPFELGGMLYGRFYLYEEAAPSDEAPGDDLVEQVFGPTDAADDEEDDDYWDDDPTDQEWVEWLNAIDWPVTSWREPDEYWWGQERRPNNVKSWLPLPLIDNRPKFGPKAILLIFRDDRRDQDNLVEMIRSALGPDARARRHGRRSLLIVGRQDVGVEQLCGIERLNRRLMDSRFAMTVCFEIGPREKSLTQSMHGPLIPARSTGSTASVFALESQGRRWRGGRGNRRG